MKRVLALVLGLSVMCSVAAIAQDAASAGSTDKTEASAPLKTIKGTVKIDGDKATFVSDDDQKSWDVQNPEAVKGHDGHHVQVSAHVYADKMAIHVMKVKMLKGSSM